VGHAQALALGILDFQPTGNLFRRPVQNQFTRNHLLQLHVDGKKAPLRPEGRLPGFAVGLVGSIQRTAIMTCDFPAHGRHRSVQAFGNLTYRRARSEPSRDLLASAAGPPEQTHRDATPNNEWTNAPCRTRARSHATTVPPSNDATCRSSAPRKAQTVCLGS
jgi:hypothetical protein